MLYYEYYCTRLSVIIDYTSFNCIICNFVLYGFDTKVIMFSFHVLLGFIFIVSVAGHRGHVELVTVRFDIIGMIATPVHKPTVGRIKQL